MHFLVGIAIFYLASDLKQVHCGDMENLVEAQIYPTSDRIFKALKVPKYSQRSMTAVARDWDGMVNAMYEAPGKPRGFLDYMKEMHKETKRKFGIPVDEPDLLEQLAGILGLSDNPDYNPYPVPQYPVQYVMVPNPQADGNLAVLEQPQVFQQNSVIQLQGDQTQGSGVVSLSEVPALAPHRGVIQAPNPYIAGIPPPPPANSGGLLGNILGGGLNRGGQKLLGDGGGLLGLGILSGPPPTQGLLGSRGGPLGLGILGGPASPPQPQIQVVPVSIQPQSVQAPVQQPGQQQVPVIRLPVGVPSESAQAVDTRTLQQFRNSPQRIRVNSK